MNLKQAIAASLLMIPVAAASLSAKPASAHDVVVKRVEFERVRFFNPERRFFHHDYRYRVWVPGHFEFNRFGYRYWVPGHFIYR
jgi:hypothetical protein